MRLTQGAQHRFPWEHIKSKDSQDYLDSLFATLGQARPELQKLAEAGAQIDVACFWISSHGGPSMSPERAAKFSELGLALWYDVYLGRAAGQLAPTVGPGPLRSRVSTGHHSPSRPSPDYKASAAV